MFQITEGTMNVGTVVLLGMGIVFVGLVCIVLMCWLMGVIVRSLEKKPAPVAKVPAASPAVPVVSEIPNRSELVAVIACALAEELGTDVSAIRICSLKKV